MLPFCGYNMADYFGPTGCRSASATAADKLPKIFFVNWFRRDERRPLPVARLRREQPRPEVGVRAGGRRRRRRRDADRPAADARRARHHRPRGQPTTTWRRCSSVDAAGWRSRGPARSASTTPASAASCPPARRAPRHPRSPSSADLTEIGPTTGGHLADLEGAGAPVWRCGRRRAPPPTRRAAMTSAQVNLADALGTGHRHQQLGIHHCLDLIGVAVEQRGRRPDVEQVSSSPMVLARTMPVSPSASRRSCRLPLAGSGTCARTTCARPGSRCPRPTAHRPCRASPRWRDGRSTGATSEVQRTRRQPFPIAGRHRPASRWSLTADQSDMPVAAVMGTNREPQSDEPLRRRPRALAADQILGSSSPDAAQQPRGKSVKQRVQRGRTSLAPQCVARRPAGELGGDGLEPVDRSIEGLGLFDRADLLRQPLRRTSSMSWSSAPRGRPDAASGLYPVGAPSTQCDPWISPTPASWLRSARCSRVPRRRRSSSPTRGSKPTTSRGVLARTTSRCTSPRPVKAPMLALAAEFSQYGDFHLFRPNRDVRFSANKLLLQDRPGTPWPVMRGGHLRADLGGGADGRASVATSMMIA